MSICLKVTFLVTIRFYLFQDDDFDYDDDDFSDEDTFDDTFEDIQAEEATELPVTIRTASIRPISRFSEYKWQQYGTMAKVEESRNEHLNLRTSKERKSGDIIGVRS